MKVLSGPAKLLEIKDSEGNGAVKRSYGVSCTYDGILDTQTQCYESKSDTEGWIHYTIEMSEVTKVSLSAKTGTLELEFLNKIEYCTNVLEFSNFKRANAFLRFLFRFNIQEDLSTQQISSPNHLKSYYLVTPFLRRKSSWSKTSCW